MTAVVGSALSERRQARHEAATWRRDQRAAAYDGVFHALAVLDAETQAKIRLNPDSASGFAFYEPERTSDPGMLMTRLIRRIKAALPRAAQQTAYLERGEPLVR
ncbi:hypothetical protein ABT010_31310 [Streptomyces sp. NPDC002668]|uniref:hypothetical protein n=1 Tax=Streptomyces sp. NPDC002668 TaxID=3154422 RepID=UPI0033332B3D